MWFNLVGSLERVVVFSVGEKLLPVNVVCMHALCVYVFACESASKEFSDVVVDFRHIREYVFIVSPECLHVENVSGLVEKAREWLANLASFNS